MTGGTCLGTHQLGARDWAGRAACACGRVRVCRPASHALSGRVAQITDQPEVGESQPSFRPAAGLRERLANQEERRSSRDDIRLTADQLAELVRGNTVTLQVSTGSTRPWLMAGTVVRVGPTEVIVSVAGASGELRIERFSRRDGRRVGVGAAEAELVNAPSASRAAAERHQGTGQLDALWLAWRRNRVNDQTLRRVHAAIVRSTNRRRMRASSPQTIRVRAQSDGE